MAINPGLGGNVNNGDQSTNLELTQVLVDEDSNRFSNHSFHLLGRCNQSIPQVFRALPAPPHGQQRIVMIDDSFGDNQRVGRVGKEAAYYTLQRN
jgi:hypothetical protein